MSLWVKQFAQTSPSSFFLTQVVVCFQALQMIMFFSPPRLSNIKDGIGLWSASM